MNNTIQNHWISLLICFIAAYYFCSQFWGSSITVVNHQVRVIPYEVIDHWRDNSPRSGSYAYFQYATSQTYLNLAIINFITLRKSHTAIKDLVLLYNAELQKDANFPVFQNMASEWDIQLREVDVIASANSESSTWSESFTKLKIFDHDEYDRIVYFDADSMLLDVAQGPHGQKETKPANLDELFAIPPEVDIAMPQAYWLYDKPKNTPKDTKVPSAEEYKNEVQRVLENTNVAFTDLPALLFDDHKLHHRSDFFASHVIVARPSNAVFRELMKYVHNPLIWHLTNRQGLRKRSDYDMEVLNKYLDDKIRIELLIKVGILPHQRYGIITGEFKEKSHDRFLLQPQHLYLSTEEGQEEWDAWKVLAGAKLVHFSDAPIPKPWEQQDNFDFYNVYKIYCHDETFNEGRFNAQYPVHRPRLVADCKAAEAWDWIMAEFERYRDGFWEAEE